MDASRKMRWNAFAMMYVAILGAMASLGLAFFALRIMARFPVGESRDLACIMGIGCFAIVAVTTVSPTEYPHAFGFRKEAILLARVREMTDLMMPWNPAMFLGRAALLFLRLLSGFRFPR